MKLIDDVSDIAALYNTDPGKEDLRLDRHQLEHDITWRYLDHFLPPAGSILEVGAGTGRYTLELARRGYRITAVDLSEHELEWCGRRLDGAGYSGQVRLVVGDGRDLRGVEGPFDAALLMGPLYHLVVESDRITALQQAYDRLKEGGILFSAFISRYGILGDLMKRTPEWIEAASSIRSLMERGRDPEGHPSGGFRGYFARADEIAPLHERIGFETLLMAAVEPAISSASDDEIYNRLEGKQRRLWLDLLLEISTQESIIGASRHLLYVGKKPQKRTTG
jgi:SAM-dependent methyltransferase